MKLLTAPKIKGLIEAPKVVSIGFHWYNVGEVQWRFPEIGRKYQERINQYKVSIDAKIKNKNHEKI